MTLISNPQVVEEENQDKFLALDLGTCAETTECDTVKGAWLPGVVGSGESLSFLMSMLSF